MNMLGVHDGVAPQTSNRKFSSTSLPRGVWATSGWNWTPYHGFDSWRNAAIGEPSLCATVTKPGGSERT